MWDWWQTATLEQFLLFGVAVMNAITVILAAKTRKDVRVVEVATNSMKDALVKATGQAAFAAGVKSGTAKEKARKK